MSKGNKRAKEELIRLYGPECFIERLHLRAEKDRRYTGKKQYERMKQLTYHHIKERCKGGQATVENGALLSAENHQWFNQQSRERQAIMNQAFQDLKKRIDNARGCKIELVDTLDMGFEVKTAEISFSDERKPKEKFNRAKEKREFEKRVREEMEEDER